MARTTTNYGFNISEGSDLVNPLTDIFPNFESLDGDLKEVSNATFGVATELKTGTVHALTRDDQNKTVFKFTATANFTAGDTFTLDGAQVSALTTAGEQLTTGCYIIGSEVIVAVKGTLLTFFISNVVTDASTLEGHSASYFASASDLSETDANVLAVSNKVGSAVLTTTAQDCSSAINELNTHLSKKMNNVFSSSEEEIGTWIDNKPLYRKIYTYSGSAITSSIVIDPSLSSNYVDSVVSFDGTILRNGLFLPMQRTYSSNDVTEPHIDTNGLTLNIRGNNPVSAYVLTVLYTKL